MNNLEYIEALKKVKKYNKDPESLSKYQGISKREQVQTNQSNIQFLTLL